jgi:hypothetical protein
MDLKTSIIRQKYLNESERFNLLNLHQQYYDNVKPEIFFNDLSEKDWIIIIKDQSGNLLGFTTIQLIWLDIRNTKHMYLYSGDTIVIERIRNSPVLAGAFAHFMNALINNYPNTPIHWFLISKGYRTYRFLPVYFIEYYPVHDKSIPSDYQQVLDSIAIYKFGYEYNPITQIIHHKEEKDRLRPEFAEIYEAKKKDADIHFFFEKNPFFYKGDELACISDIRHSNFKPLVDRILKNTKVNFNWNSE